MEFHDVASIFPMMDADEFASLKKSIAEIGQQEAIYTYQGKIIDGRNRYNACVEIGVEPKFREWNGVGSLVAFVVSENLHRRHLNSSQRAVIALDVERQLAEEAKQRQKTAAIELNKKLGRLPDLSKQDELKIFNMTNFVCPDCAELFDREVWHCPVCNHHWPLDRDNCWNCHEGKRPEALFQLIEKASGPIHAAEQAAAITGTNRQYVSDAKKLAANAPDLIDKVRDGELTIPEAKREYKDRKNEEARQQAASQGAGVDLPLNAQIIHGDFREILENMPANSVDLIFTDPPYDAESIPMYGDLARLGARVLKPGGSLIAYVGHYAIGDIYNLMSAHLRFWWTLAVKHNGGAARLIGKYVFVEWKPMVWFVKERRRCDEYVADMIESSPPTKADHNWQQSCREADYYIERLTAPGEVVLDPFAGSGTTIISAYKLGRTGIGIEIDGERANVAKNRIYTECGLSTSQETGIRCDGLFDQSRIYNA